MLNALNNILIGLNICLLYVGNGYHGNALFVETETIYDLISII